MTSRERVQAAIEHKIPDKTPRDFGGIRVTGLAASFMFKLRRELVYKAFIRYQTIAQLPVVRNALIW